MFNRIRHVLGLPMLSRARRSARHFLEQTHRAPEVQHRLLLDLIARHADSQFGRDHHFRSIRSSADFRRQVPVRGYDGHEPYISRVRQGDTGALFGPGTEVLMFAMTSGTTAKPKTIPVTRESLENYREGWTIWGILAFDSHPKIIEAGLRPILQFASDWRESFTPGGVPCGAVSGLTSHMQNPLVRIVYCMPPATTRIKSVEARYYTALRLSIYRDLGTVIAANPSTSINLARLGDREKETLIRDIHDGTLSARWDIPQEVHHALRWRIAWKRPKAAARLESIVARTGHLLPRDYWSNLEYLSNWTGGAMGAYLHHFGSLFGDRPVRDIGLIASEGRFTIPIEDNTPAGILDIRHHYFEFIPEEQGDLEEPDTFEAHELTVGQTYYILPTTAGGLYRYHIHDVVRCVGFHGQAPVIEFLNKGAHFSSLTGEKLSEFQVVTAVKEAQALLNLKLESFLLLPTWGDPPRYELLVGDDDLDGDIAAGRLAAEVDAQLSRLNLEYENKRATLRLGAIRTRRIAPGSWAQFQKRRLAKTGGTVEQYKQPCLLSDPNAHTGFQFNDLPQEMTPQLRDA